jgi:crotonobetainyl-CoA:carnitine CoA-transferase CaiB-like acyl-CoA transferase
MLLADLGAEVIKIEVPGGDTSRITAGPNYKGESYHYVGYNKNKKSLELDIMTPMGKEAFYDLVKISDVVLDNFRPGAMERLGADYESLKKINPRIICCSLTGYGSSGPYRDRPSFDPIVLGMSGFLSVNAEPGRTPVKPGPNVGDLVAGMFAALGIAAALAGRAVTGVGDKIETSMLDACFAIMTTHLTWYTLSGEALPPLGGIHPSTVPFGVYPTKEGYIALGASWPRICRVLGAEWLMDDPRFLTQADRINHREELTAILIDLLSKEKAEDWLEVFYVEDIAAGPVNTLDKAVDDPQLNHDNMILSLKHPLGGEIRVTGNPIKMPSIKEEEYTAPPLLGQHTEEILSGLLGYSEEKIRKLREEGEAHRKELETHLQKVI